MSNILFKNPLDIYKDMSNVFGTLYTNDHTKANLKEGDGCYELSLAAPGFTKSEIDIVVENEILSISGKKEIVNDKYLWQEFHTSSFSRKFSLPKNINTENIEASCVDGVLLIKLPFLKKEKRSNVIKIT